MNDIVSLIVTVLGVLLALCVLAGIVYGLCLVVREAQKKDKAYKEFQRKYRG